MAPGGLSAPEPPRSVVEGARLRVSRPSGGGSTTAAAEVSADTVLDALSLESGHSSDRNGLSRVAGGGRLPNTSERAGRAQPRERALQVLIRAEGLFGRGVLG